MTTVFTFRGLDMINKARVDHLQFPQATNTSMKMSMMGLKIEQ